MAKKATDDSQHATRVGVQSTKRLPRVDVDGYNRELKDNGGFLGDRASKKALYALLDKWRKPLAKEGKDPFGGPPSNEIGKGELDKALTKGDSGAAGVVHAVIEDFAQELAFIIRKFLRDKSWRDTQRIVVGGGLREHRVGELAIGRADILLKADGV